jgi:hypothetical protein
LLRTKDNGWYITEQRLTHNHSMSVTCGEKVYWPSHKHIDVYTKDLIKQLRENNINIGKVYSIIGSFFWRGRECTIHKENSKKSLWADK